MMIHTIVQLELRRKIHLERRKNNEFLEFFSQEQLSDSFRNFTDVLIDIYIVQKYIQY